MSRWALVLCVIVALAAVRAWLYTPDLARAALEAKYGVKPGDYVNVSGLRVHLQDRGSRAAPVVIMLHGFGSSLQTWDIWAAALAADYRVVAFDLPGFGLTGADPTGDYSDTRAVEVLARLMEQLGISRASLVGNSLGGKIAWNFAVKYPTQVTKLILVSPDGFASPGFEYGKKPDVPIIMQLLPYAMPKFMLRGSLTAAYANSDTLTPALFDRYYDMMRAPGVRRALIARMAQVNLHDPVPLLKRVIAPTLLVWGERDAMIPFTNAADYAAALPNSRLLAWPALGHVPQEEAGAATIGAIQEFLKQ